MNKIYLAGTITGLTKEEANNWRESIKSKLDDNGFNVINPYSYMDKFYNYGSDDIEKVAMDFDLAQVKDSAAVIVRLDQYKSLGTMAELAVAYSNNIPIIALNDKDNELPFYKQHTWIKAMISIQFFEESELISYVCDIFK